MRGFRVLSVTLWRACRTRTHGDVVGVERVDLLPRLIRRRVDDSILIRHPGARSLLPPPAEHVSCDLQLVKLRDTRMTSSTFSQTRSGLRADGESPTDAARDRGFADRPGRLDTRPRPRAVTHLSDASLTVSMRA